MSFECQFCHEDLVRQHITFRYGALRSKISTIEGRIEDINEVVRVKNPSLLLQIQKSRVASPDKKQNKYRR